jgi:hypothetical protein
MLKINKTIMLKVTAIMILLAGFCFAGTFQIAAQTKSIAGEWDAAMNTPGGVRSSKIIFSVDGEKLTGTVKRSAGDVPLAGTIKGNDVQFSYTISYNGNDLTMTISGKLDGDKINGTVSFGGNAEEQWSATRVVAPK